MCYITADQPVTMSELEFPEIVAMARDIAFLAVFVVVPILGFLLYRKVSALSKPFKRAKQSVQDITSTVSQEFIERARPEPERARGRRILSPLSWVWRKR